MAKESLMEAIDIPGSDRTRSERLAGGVARRAFPEVNALGIGAQGLGGLATVLDVKILSAPHSRRIQTGRDHSQLRGHSPRPFLAQWQWTRETRSPPAGRLAKSAVGRRRRKQPARGSQHPDEGGSCLMATRAAAVALRQDADGARRRAQAHFRYARARRKAAVDFTNRVIYYVGPVDPVRDEAVGPAGPTYGPRAWTGLPS